MMAPPRDTIPVTRFAVSGTYRTKDELEEYRKRDPINLCKSKLLADKAISQQDLDTAIAKEATDAANVEAARAQVKTAQLNLDYTSIAAPRAGLPSPARRRGRE